MPKPAETYMHILVKDRAYLSQIGVMGPVVQPLKVNKKDVIKMIMAGCNIYEYLLDSKQTIKLTVHNIMNDAKRHEDYFKSLNTPKESEFFFIGDDEDEPKFEDEEEEASTESTEEAAVELEPQTEDPVINPDPETKTLSPETYEFSYNEDGTVDETGIPWNQFASREERKALRARINEINSARRAD